jgi:CheY-like chemotaxis protein
MTGASVLIVEDELIVAENLRGVLTGMGYHIVGTAGDSTEAITIAGQSRPDLILMDIVLEGSELDGIETARHINSFHEIPIVFVTAYSDDGTLERAKGIAPFAYILKPFNERELYSAIELALSRHLMEQEIRKRDDILFALNFSVEWFLKYVKESRNAKTRPAETLERGIQNILEHVGLAVRANIVTVFRMNLDQEGPGGAKLQYIWAAPGMSRHLVYPCDDDSRITFSTSLWRTLLASGNIVAGEIEKFPKEDRLFFERCGISSIAILPLFRNDALWGFVGFSGDRAREWSDTEMEALTLAGNIVGGVLD